MEESDDPLAVCQEVWIPGDEGEEEEEEEKEGGLDGDGSHRSSVSPRAVEFVDAASRDSPTSVSWSSSSSSSSLPPSAQRLSSDCERRSEEDREVGGGRAGHVTGIDSPRDDRKSGRGPVGAVLGGGSSWGEFCKAANISKKPGEDWRTLRPPRSLRRHP